MTEYHIAHIAAIGIGSVLALSILSYILASSTPFSAFFSALSRYSIYYAISNILPLGQLDGTKILFGSRIWWLILTTLSIIGFALALFLI